MCSYIAVFNSSISLRRSTQISVLLLAMWWWNCCEFVIVISNEVMAQVKILQNIPVYAAFCAVQALRFICFIFERLAVWISYWNLLQYSRPHRPYRRYSWKKSCQDSGLKIDKHQDFSAFIRIRTNDEQISIAWRLTSQQTIPPAARTLCDVIAAI